MSRPRPARRGVLAEELATCDYCGSRPGEMCVTASGSPAWIPHATRSALGFAEWQRGFEAGAHDFADLVGRYFERELDKAQPNGAEGAARVALALARRQYRI